MDFSLHNVMRGLKLIPQSIRLVMAHPVLLIYGICSFVISYVLLMAFRASSYSMESHYYKKYETVLLSDTKAQFDQYYAVFMILITLISLFFLACLAHHAMHKLQNETHGFTDTLRDVIYKLPKLGIWFAFVIILRVCVFLFLSKSGMLTILSLIVIAIVSYVTSLVLPILSTEETGLITAIKRSYRLVVEYWISFIGVFLLFHLLGFTSNLAINIFVGQLAVLTYTIFYYEYYARPKPELAGLFYPDV